MPGRLTGQRIVVTGGGRGIGHGFIPFLQSRGLPGIKRAGDAVPEWAGQF